MSPIRNWIFWSLSLAVIHNCFIVDAWRPFKIAISMMNVTYNKDYCYCNGSIVNNSVSNVLYQPKSRIGNNLMTNLLLYSFKKDGNRPLFINITANICETFKKPNLPPIVSGIYRHIVSKLDMPLRCPVEPRIYHMTEAGRVEEELPPYVPLNSYKLIFHFFVQEKAKFSSLCTISFVARVLPNSVKRIRNSKH